METQPRNASAQVTLLEASFVFLPGLRRVPLVWGEYSSSEQHSFGKLPNAAAATIRSQWLVVLQARAQLQETIIARRRQHKCAGD
jgi:hypothetical protein